jgi:hypothetical protein
MDRKRIEAVLRESAALTRKTNADIRHGAGEVRRAAAQVDPPQKREEMLEFARRLDALATNGRDPRRGWLN